MGWRKLVSALVGKHTPSAAEAFLDELIAAGHALAPAPDPTDPAGRVPYVTKPVQELRYSSAGEVLTLDYLHFYGRNFTGIGGIEPLLFSEIVREVEAAAVAAAPDRTAVLVSAEVMAARAALVRAFVPAAVVEGETARLGGHRLHLGSGAVYGPDGAALALPALSTPATFPYPDPDAGTAEVVARALYLAGQTG